MRKIELVSWDNLHERVENIKRSLENIYEVELTVEREYVPLERLYPTEDFLEKDKLALIFMKVVREDYNVPIIAVERNEDRFILDGHHRSYVSKKISKESIEAYVLRFPKGKSHRLLPKHSLGNLPIRDVAPIDDSVLTTWGQVLTLLKYYEALYKMSFSLKKEDVPLKDLVPTQPQAMKERITSIKELLVPIVCIKQHGKSYILDGHARSLRAKQLGLKSVDAIILSPETNINFGIVETARKMHLKNLEDIKIVE